MLEPDNCFAPVPCSLDNAYSLGATMRDVFAIQILNGLIAKYGVPGRAPPYRTELPTPLSDIAEQADYERRRGEWLRKLESHNRRAVCREAVKLADELVAALNKPTAPTLPQEQAHDREPAATTPG